MTYKRMLRCVFLFCMMGLPVVPRLAAQGAMDGWRSAEDKDLGDAQAQAFRKSDDNQYLVAVGDFNGDQIPDRTELLVNDEEQSVAIFLTLQEGETLKARSLDIENLKFIGIRTQPSGVYQEACARRKYRNPFKCDEAPINITYDSINFFTYESGSTVIYVKDGVLKEFQYRN